MDNPGNKPAEEQGHLNDVEEFVANAKSFFGTYGTWILVGVLAALVSFSGVRWLMTHREDARRTAYEELGAATSPIAMADVARRHDTVPGLAGIAYLKAGDAYLNQAVVGDENDVMALLTGAQTDARSEEEKRADLSKAVESYQQVIRLGQSDLQVLNARLGLAAAQESLGEFGAAREQYGLVLSEAGEKWDLIARRARVRLASLDSIVEPIEIVERAVPVDGGGELPPGLMDLQSFPDFSQEGFAPTIPLEGIELPGDGGVEGVDGVDGGIDDGVDSGADEGGETE